AMPNFGNDYKAFVKAMGGNQIFLTDAHTHPFHSGYPSGFDTQGLYDLGGGGAEGIIITDKGKYSLYSFIGKVPDQDFSMNRCLTDKIKMPSIHVRFPQK